MKILLVTYSISGGAGKACKRLYEALKSSGYQVKILKLEPGMNHDESIVSMYSTSQSFYFKKIISKIYKKLLDFRFKNYNKNYKLPFSVHKVENHPLVKWADIINLHWVADFIDYSRFFKLVSKPIVWTLHDMLPFSGGYHYSLDRIPNSTKTERIIIDLKRKYLMKSNIKIVAPSKWLVSISSRSEAFEDFQHKHIFNPLPTNIFKPHNKEFSRRVLNLPEDGKIVVFSADNITSHRKGMSVLIKALNSLNLSNLTLVSIGRNEIQINSKIPHIHLGSLKDDYTISLLYSAANVSVVPSKEDNSPNTIIESFACGCPVIAFNVGGISELLYSNKLGVLIDGFKNVDLSNAITQALNKKYSKRLMRTFIESEFGYNVASKNYISVFKSFE